MECLAVELFIRIKVTNLKVTKSVKLAEGCSILLLRSIVFVDVIM